MKQKTYRLLSTLLLLCMTLALLSVEALAASTSGPCGDGVIWSYNDGTLTIKGTGSMDNYYSSDDNLILARPWKDYQTQIHSISVDDGVTTIGAAAFAGYDYLTSVTIPNSVTAIRHWAFFSSGNSGGLARVTIPDSVTAIGRCAFAACHNLTNINVIGGNPAYTSVDGILFNADQTLLHSYPAGRNDRTYRIPSSVTTIGEGAFTNCINLTSVTIPNRVTTIGEGAFASCFNLTSVTIPNSVTTIGEMSFQDCISLKDIYYSGSENQWKQIAIGEENAPLLKAAIHYNPDDNGNTASAVPDGITVTVSGKAVVWTDAKPFIDANSRTMVPLRAVADAMGLEVNWNAAAREAAFTEGNKTIYFPIGSSIARVSGSNTIQMDTATVIVDERTYAPIRYLAEFFNYEVYWDAATRTVIIK